MKKVKKQSEESNKVKKVRYSPQIGGVLVSHYSMVTPGASRPPSDATGFLLKARLPVVTRFSKADSVNILAAESAVKNSRWAYC